MSASRPLSRRSAASASPASRRSAQRCRRARIAVRAARRSAGSSRKTGVPQMDEVILPGEVGLVGAGPGDPDLLSRKAEKLLRAASIVFYDALVGPGVLALIPAGVRRVAVGKRSGRHSKDQGTISMLLVEAGLAGGRVVRLKGG